MPSLHATTAAEYIDRIKDKTGLVSDYQVSQLLNITRSAVSRYRRNDGHFEADTALKVAITLDIDPLLVILDSAIFRAKTPKQKQFYFDALKEHLNNKKLSLSSYFGTPNEKPAPRYT